MVTSYDFASYHADVVWRKAVTARNVTTSRDEASREMATWCYEGVTSHSDVV